MGGYTTCYRTLRSEVGNQRVLCIHVQVKASVLSQEMSLLDKEGLLLRGEALLVCRPCMYPIHVLSETRFPY